MIKKVQYTISDLEKASDQDVISMIYDKYVELISETFGENLDKVNNAFAEFGAIRILEVEVCNSGFDQFFLIYELELEKFIIEGLESIGAEKYLPLFKKAIDIFKNQSCEFANKRNPAFDILDDEFYNLEGLEHLQIKYIRNNYDKFVAK